MKIIWALSALATILLCIPRKDHSSFDRSLSIEGALLWLQLEVCVCVQSFWSCWFFLLCLLISRHVCSKLFKPRRLNCRVFCIFLNVLKFAFASPSHSFPFILLVPQVFSSVVAASARSPFQQPILYLSWAGQATKSSSVSCLEWRPTLRLQTLRRELRYASEWAGLRFLLHLWVGRRPGARFF